MNLLDTLYDTAATLQESHVLAIDAGHIEIANMIRRAAIEVSNAIGKLVVAMPAGMERS